MPLPELLVPDLVWLDGRFRAGKAVLVGDDGRIAAVSDRPPSHSGELRLPGRALLPGFVNAHSHSFQRLIRGRTQWRPATGEHTEEDFWSWRGAMYAAANALTPDDIHDVARFCFLEMMRTGITAVGEFHYLHHQPGGEPYPDPNETARRVIDAAAGIGIRIVLLNVCYATGGIGGRLGRVQRRFRADSPASFLDRTTALADAVAEYPMATVGVAPHSIRAVPRDWLPRLADWARRRGAPVHMHVAERPAEVAECRAAYGLRPVELLSEDGLLDERFTAVHATHLTDGEVMRLGESGATVCACPTTERDLGDGLLRGLDLLRAGVPICLGTDSHATLDFFEEMRLVEYHERLTRLERVVITERIGDRRDVGPPLLRMATADGARSLRIDAGRIEPGALADLVAIDLDHPALAGWTPDTLAAHLTLSAPTGVVRDVWVGGRRRLEDRGHAAGDAALAAFRAVAAKHGGVALP